jgi:hypothetical protein
METCESVPMSSLMMRGAVSPKHEDSTHKGVLCRSRGLRGRIEVVGV